MIRLFLTEQRLGGPARLGVRTVTSFKSSDTEADTAVVENKISSIHSFMDAHSSVLDASSHRSTWFGSGSSGEAVDATGI